MRLSLIVSTFAMLRVASLVRPLRPLLVARMATQGTRDRELSSTASSRAPINNVAVIGSGLMGAGIAQVLDRICSSVLTIHAVLQSVLLYAGCSSNRSHCVPSRREGGAPGQSTCLHHLLHTESGKENILRGSESKWKLETRVILSLPLTIRDSRLYTCELHLYRSTCTYMYVCYAACDVVDLCPY